MDTWEQPNSQSYMLLKLTGRIANILGVSLDYLVGNTDLELDQEALSRVMEIQLLPDDIKEKVYYFIDISIKDYKTRKGYRV